MRQWQYTDQGYRSALQAARAHIEEYNEKVTIVVEHRLSDARAIWVGEIYSPINNFLGYL